MAKDSLFLSFIRLTLKKWVGFQVAIEEGMGGPYAKEKELWLGSEIENYFKSYAPDVTPDDLEEYVATMIENEFDTRFEDGSLLETCKLFCRAYSLSSVNPDAPLFQSLKIQEPASVKTNSPIPATTETISEKTVTLEIEKLEIKDPEEDSWTTVTRKGHKK